MARFGQTYSQDQLPKRAPAIPANTYLVRIDKAELAETKAGGQRLRVGYVIMGPSHQGQYLWDSINLRNANPQAQEIGLRDFGDLLRACGIVSIADTDQLIGHQLKVKVTMEKATGEYGDANGMENRIKGRYSVAPTAPVSAPSAPPAPAAPLAPSAPSAPAAQAPASAPAPAAPDSDESPFG